MIVWASNFHACRQTKPSVFAKRLFVPVRNIGDQQARLVERLNAGQPNSANAVKPKPAQQRASPVLGREFFHHIVAAHTVRLSSLEDARPAFLIKSLRNNWVRLAGSGIALTINAPSNAEGAVGQRVDCLFRVPNLFVLSGVADYRSCRALHKCAVCALTKRRYFSSPAIQPRETSRRLRHLRDVLGDERHLNNHVIAPVAAGFICPSACLYFSAMPASAKEVSSKTISTFP